MRRSSAWIAWIAFVLTGAATLAGADRHASLVPWKVLEPGTPLDPSPLVLFWVPASREELRRSELLTSDELTLYSSHCVAMRIVRLDDYALLDRLGVRDSVPAVVLTDGSGVVRRSGGSSVAEVEAMVREELFDRAAAAEGRLDQAREKAESGQTKAAMDIYQEVWEQRCVCPRQGRAAGRALRKLQSR